MIFILICQKVITDCREKAIKIKNMVSRLIVYSNEGASSAFSIQSINKAALWKGMVIK